MSSLKKLERQLRKFQYDLENILDDDEVVSEETVARTKAIIERCIQIALLVANHLPARNKREQAYSIAMGKCLDGLDLDRILDGSAMAEMMAPAFQRSAIRASKEAANV